MVICQQLQAKGLNPSVALLRARSTLSLSIPQAVKAVQEWNQLRKTMDNQALSLLIKEQHTEAQASEGAPDIIADMERRLIGLEKEIASIRSTLAQLK